MTHAFAEIVTGERIIDIVGNLTKRNIDQEESRHDEIDD